jgi:hypothetical protein
MKSKVITGIMLILLFLMFTLSTMLVTPIARAYPFEDIFKKDLLNIANSVPQIEVIYIKGWLDLRPSGHFWGFIRINYTAGLSDFEKIDIQNYVQHQLESKEYIDIVEPNYIYSIPEQPIPWPGFVIGDLNIAFKSMKIGAVIDINPSTLNLKSRGQWITCYIGLPEGYNVSDINRATILLNGTIPVAPFWVDKPLESVIGDYNNDTVPDLMVKFNRTQVISYIIKSLGFEPINFTEVTLTVAGELYDGTQFEGSEVIRVIMPTVLGTGWGQMLIESGRYVWGRTELYRLETRVELTIMYKGEEYSITWSIIRCRNITRKYWHMQVHMQEYLCYSEELGFATVRLSDWVWWRSWSLYGRGVWAFGFT